MHFVRRGCPVATLLLFEAHLTKQFFHNDQLYRDKGITTVSPRTTQSHPTLNRKKRKGYCQDMLHGYSPATEPLACRCA